MTESPLPGDGCQEVAARLRLIERQLLFPDNMQVSEGEVFVAQGDSLELTSKESVNLTIAVDVVYQWEKDKRIKGCLKIYRGKRLLGNLSIEGILVRADAEAGLRPWYDENSFAVDVEDQLQLGNITLTIEKILSTIPFGRLTGDERSGIVFSVQKQGP